MAVVAAGLLVAAGCSSSSSGADAASVAESEAATPAAGEASARAALDQGATVVDVRTPEEFAAGHIEGAALIDVQDPSFADEIAGLDDSVTYVVYCRSGNRSAAAAAQMEAVGLTVLDGGALEDMTAAGWPTAA
jgi:rhodanese-related sulfurtransferase